MTISHFTESNWGHELADFFADSKRQKKPTRDGDISGISLERTLTLLDLILLGVGGTLGSGLFLLAGRVARDIAGPAVSLSFVTAAIACVFSGLSYAEMSSRLPACGGAYSFVYYAIGELPAFLVGMCLTLEYGVSSAAVSRAWAAYIGEVFLFLPGWITGRGSTWCVLGCCLMICISTLIAVGMKETKWVINTATFLYAIVVAVIIAVGIPKVQLGNWSPFVPYGFQSIITGASAVFFSYIGFDEVATVAEEAKNPSRNVPLAILLSLFTVAFLYVASTLVLTGIVNYKMIDFEAPFPAAFRTIGMPSLAVAVGIGVAVGMLNTALVGILAQTRLFLALSQDGLIPRSLGDNSRKSAVVCGFIVSILSLCVPTQALTDVVSGGTLLAFLGTNISLVLTRYKVQPASINSNNKGMIFWYAAGAILFGFAIRLPETHGFKPYMFGLASPLLIMPAILINRDNLNNTQEELEAPAFKCPAIPNVPLLGIFTTAILFAQLSKKALMALFLWLAFAVCIYSTHGRFNSYANSVAPIPNERTAVNEG